MDILLRTSVLTASRACLGSVCPTSYRLKTFYPKLLHWKIVILMSKFLWLPTLLLLILSKSTNNEERKELGVEFFREQTLAFSVIGLWSSGCTCGFSIHWRVIFLLFHRGAHWRILTPSVFSNWCDTSFGDHAVGEAVLWSFCLNCGKSTGGNTVSPALTLTDWLSFKH